MLLPGLVSEPANKATESITSGVTETCQNTSVAVPHPDLIPTNSEHESDALNKKILWLLRANELLASKLGKHAEVLIRVDCTYITIPETTTVSVIALLSSIRVWF